MKRINLFNFSKHVTSFLLVLFTLISLQAQKPAKLCTFTPDYTINTPQNATAILPGSGLTGKKFLVNADLTIDKLYSFNQCLFKIAPGVKIKIAKGTSFIECNLYNCGTICDKWYGITLETINTGLTVTLSTIENATYGVEIDNKTGTSFYCDQNDFFNNYCGIHVANNTTFVADVIWGNEFHGSPVSFFPTTPALACIPMYGIKVDGPTGNVFSWQLIMNIGTYLGHGVPAPNQFYSLYSTGIHMTQAKSRIRGCTFSNFHLFGGSGLSIAANGIGIRNIDSDIWVENDITDPYPRITFHNLDYGIYTSVSTGYTQTQVYGAKFTWCASWACWTDFTSSSGGHIFLAEYNDIEQTQTALSRFNGARKTFSGIGITGYGYCDVTLNNFKTDIDNTTDSKPNYQFYYNGTGIGEKEIIRSNSLVANDFRTSIENASSVYIVNFPGWFQIEENEFHWYPWLSGPSPSPAWGMFAMDSKELLVRRNIFDNDLLHDAMHINNVGLSQYCQNVVHDNVYYGFHALNVNTIALAQTSFGVAEYGLYLHKPLTVDPDILPQVYRDNCWASSYVIDAVNESSFPLTSQFDVPNTTCYLPGSISPPFWFAAGTPTHRDTCQREPAPWLQMRSSGDALTWDGELQWYQIIHKRGASNDFESDFMTTMEETALPDLVEIEDQMNEAVYMGNDQDAELKALSDAGFNLKEQIDSILKENNGNILSNEELAAIEGLLNAIETASIDQYSILADLNSGNVTALNSLLIDLNGLSVTTPQEITYKNYLKLVIGVALNGLNDDDNIALAQQLSASDEVEYGPGARKAAHFLPSDEYQDFVATQVEICKSNLVDFRVQQPVELESNSLKSWLLESNGVRNYNLDYKGESETTYLLYGINGNLISSGKVFPGNNDYNFRNIPTGYYVFKLKNGTQIQRLFFEP